MQSHSQKNADTHICHHCGAENARIPELWISSAGDGKKAVCSDCGKTLFGDQNPGLMNSKKTGKSGFNISFFIIAVLLSSLIIYLNRTFDVLSFMEDSGQIVYEILLVLIVSSSIASGKIWTNLRHLAIWAGIFLILMVGYSYRHEMSAIKEKVFAELVPSKGYQKTMDSISFPVSSDGHFYIIAEVNGTPVTFLADTGASHIVLSPADAEKIGIEKTELYFDRFYETANGMVRGSSIRIADFRIGEIYLKEIGASVNEAEMRNSLLGMTFFKRLKSYEVKDNVLTLHWKR
jgi:aspartyl protease family protein